MTFSVVARDHVTGDFGCAVQSKFLAVGAAVIHARAGVGAVATQALSNVSYGARGLALLEAGASARQALDVLVTSDLLPHRRQAGITDENGHAAGHTGTGCTAWAGHVVGEGYSCQGNMLVSVKTIDAMARVMEEQSGSPFPERLVRCLAAGQEAGGDARGQQSAAILVVRAGGGYGGLSDRLIDLRVDDHPHPIDELGRLLGLHHLYFDRPAQGDLVAIDGELRTEVAAILTRLQHAPLDGADADAVWIRLDRWVGRENLEERMVKPGWIDSIVLSILRQRGATGDEP